jgi:arsenite methyltransferase
VTHESVQHYYGEVIQRTEDLRTSACTTDTPLPARYRRALANVHDEVLARYYGCGLVCPPAIKGLRVLDLGSGSGRDCYALAQLVGTDGAVVGVDMTEAQLDVARRHLDWHRERFGYPQSNVAFHHGYLETLEALPLADESFDLIISNCVINLALDKGAVLRNAWRLLKPGGEFYFADIYADRRVPASLAAEPVLYGECLGGALYWNDFLTLARSAGFLDPRLVEDRPVAVTEETISEKVAPIRFYSATWRLFKLPALEPACEDYGQAVVYRGTVEDAAASFMLDKHHVFTRGKMHLVCGNTWRMLHETRLKPHFDFHGDWSTHYGIFEGCGTLLPFDAESANGAPIGACC